jgi:hypothetical protein
MKECGGVKVHLHSVAYQGIFLSGRRGSTNPAADNGRENGDLGAVVRYSEVPLNLQMSDTGIIIRLSRMYFPRNWEFGSALSTLRNFGGGGF